MPLDEAVRIVAWPVIGAIVGAFIAFLYNRRLAGVKVAFDLHTEFHSESLLRSRIETDKALRRAITEQKRKTLDAIKESCATEEWFHVSRVLHFFEKLSLANEYKLVPRDICLSLFGHYIDYFRSCYFDRIAEDTGQWQPLILALRNLPQRKNA
jgi:hypothetical protein